MHEGSLPEPTKSRAAEMATPERCGRYLVFAPFARGGMASVHLGRLLGAAGFSRLVAIKKPHANSALADAYERMLLDEARLTSRIRHPNVVEAVDIVRQSGSLFLVMEYVHGVSLASLIGAAIRAGRAIPHDILSAILIDFLRGLHAAHEAKAEDGTPLGIVHRDVSPQNILVGADGVSRVLDFGVAKAIRKDHLSTQGELKGKLAYMSPEQVRGHGVTRQSDLFVTGIVLWEALAGQRLYAQEDVPAMLLGILSRTPEPPSTHAPDVPRALDALVGRALAQQPRARFASAEEMAFELASACPPASAEDVARFVEYMAGDELAARTEMVRAVESYEWPDTDGSLSIRRVRLDPEARSRRVRGRILAVAFALTCLCLLASAIVSARAYVDPHANEDPFPYPTADPHPESSATSAPSPTHATARLTDFPTAPVTLPEPVLELDEQAARRAGARPKPGARQASEAPPAARRPATTACEPPYTMDERGKKHYKPECL